MKHPNNLLNAMWSAGYGLEDLLPAFPGRDLEYLGQLTKEGACCLSRPVLPYGLLGVNPVKGKLFNFSEAGFRFSQTSQPWPPPGDRKVVFFFGGSTTLGFGVEDSETIPACLQACLDESHEDYIIYNFGSGNYTARHEALRFLDLIDQGHVPDIAIFLDGFNEAQTAIGSQDLVYALDFLYQGEKRRRRKTFFPALVDYALERWGNVPILPLSQNFKPAQESPELMELLSDAGITRCLSRSQSTEDEAIPQGLSKLCESTWSRYLCSLSLTTAIAKKHAVRTFFFWQPVPFFACTSRQRIMEGLYRVFRAGVLSYPFYRWLHQHKFPELEEALEFINLSSLGESVDSVLYYDNCHYTPEFCRILGRIIGEYVTAHSRVPRWDTQMGWSTRSRREF